MVPLEAEMEIVAWWDDEEKAGYGYDYYFTPAKPEDPEYRQLQSEAQKLWLAHWEPYEGDLPH